MDIECHAVNAVTDNHIYHIAILKYIMLPFSRIIIIVSINLIPISCSYEVIDHSQ